MKSDDCPRVGEALARFIDRAHPDDLFFGCVITLFIGGLFLIVLTSTVLLVAFSH